MKEYTFKIYKQDTITIPAENEGLAWVEISKINPDLLGLEWLYELVETPESKNFALAEGLHGDEEFIDPLEASYLADYAAHSFPIDKDSF